MLQVLANTKVVIICNTQMYQINMLCTLNLDNVIYNYISVKERRAWVLESGGPELQLAHL